MIAFMKKLWRDRRGNALMIAGAALPLLVGSAGLATDTIQWTLWKRQLAARRGFRGVRRRLCESSRRFATGDRGRRATSP